MATCKDTEGWTIVSHMREFDLTPCAEEGIIRPALLCLVLISAVWRLWTSRSSDRREIASTSLTILKTKLALLTIAFLTSCASLIYILFSPVEVPILIPYLLEPAAILVSIILTYYNHLCTTSASTILLLFWPLYVLSAGIWTRTLISNSLSPELSILLALRSAVVVFGLVSFALETLGSENGAKASNESPVLSANIFSIWSFSWMTPLMKKGAETFITESDLPPLVPRDKSEKLASDLDSALSKHTSLWIALATAYGGPFLVAAGLKVVQDFLAFLQPQLLRWLLAYISTYQSTKDMDGTAFDISSESQGPSPLQGFAIATIMFVAAIVQTIVLHQYFQRCFETGMRVRAGLVTVIFDKALKLSNDERGRSTGDIVNLMSVDATRLQDLCTYGLIAVSGPLQIVLAFISLYDLLGWSAFVGVGIMVVSVPLNTAIARMLRRMQEEQMKNRDKRTRLMSELLANIKSIKLYAWEYTFIRRVLFVRNDLEVKMMKRIGIATALNTTLWTGIPLLVAFSSFASAALVSSTPLTADVIFPAISLFMLLQFPLAMFAQVTSNIIEAVVSINRLSDFLHAGELQPDALIRAPKKALRIGDEVLSIKDGEFKWTKQPNDPATLEDIDLTVRKGELVGVTGRVGAGKSSLLAAIIGDMRRTEGEVVLYGSVSYAPQNPWILSATVRENILFSHEYDETFYNLVIDACALKQDLALLPQGDLTEVGEKGITLSGGQRARVSLARAVYARADLVLLDDVLAAVDSHVARHVFDNVIGPQGLLATKGRILVTNSIAYLKYFDRIAYIRRGIITECDSFAALMANPEGDLRKLVQNHATGSISSGSSTPGHLSGLSTPKVESEGDSELSANLDLVTEKIERRGSFGKSILATDISTRASSDGPTKEHSEQGRVKNEVYTEYLKAASRQGFFFFILATMMQQAVSVVSNVVLRLWGEHNRVAGDNSGMFDYLLGYALFSGASVVFGGAASIILWVYCSLRSARYLHDSMLDSVMHAPLSFFELTPTGRILNLFSRDTYVVDQILARVIQNLFRTGAVCISIVIVIGWSFPPFLLVVPPLGWFYSRVMAYYLSTSRELKRLDATSRSPIFAWFSESLSGLSTIRAFSQQKIFIANNARRLDRNQICYLPSISVNRWLAVRLEFVGAVIIYIAAMLAVAALITTGVDAGLVGLVLSYALNTTSSLNWVVRSASEVEQNIVSVERILHYVTDLDHEAPHEIPEKKPVGEWPSEGAVEFRDYSTKYRPELEPVLKSIVMSIKPKEKIGICGRTGAGKSSLLLALFRIIEPISGTILIDGVDITKIGLHDLRSVISIVPQNPDLFEGTLRENIDPVGQHQDADIWTALEQAHLKPYVESLPMGLDAPVKEGGSSLSSGQRQLICFARALLRKSKILVLDEATSAVDLDTDRAIQDIIRGPQFTDVTILTIAHRLNTIIESDRVLVLDAGKIAEFDSPKNLLDNNSSIFYSLASEAGLTQGQVTDSSS